MSDLDWVNVVAVKWVNDGRSIALLAGVPNSSFYGENMAQTKGYIVNAQSGAIEHMYDSAELTGVFRSDLNTIVP